MSLSCVNLLLLFTFIKLAVAFLCGYKIYNFTYGLCSFPLRFPLLVLFIFSTILHDNIFSFLVFSPFFHLCKYIFCSCFPQPLSTVHSRISLYMYIKMYLISLFFCWYSYCIFIILRCMDNVLPLFIEWIVSSVRLQLHAGCFSFSFYQVNASWCFASFNMFIIFILLFLLFRFLSTFFSGFTPREIHTPMRTSTLFTCVYYYFVCSHFQSIYFPQSFSFISVDINDKNM